MFEVLQEQQKDIYHLLIFGLVLSIILMAVAANLISRWIKKYKWIAWFGLISYINGSNRFNIY